MKHILILVLMLCLLTLPALAQDAPVLLFIGQDLGSVGGLEGYDQGYIDALGMPDGVTSYTSLPGLDGLTIPANWGAGDVCAAKYVVDESFADTDIALGVYMVDQLKNISLDLEKEPIRRLGEFIASAAPRTIYLRLGYEFNGSWNHYDPKDYISAFRMIVDSLRLQGVTNFQTVWQSYGYGTADELLAWYPGDDYVDWLGYSYFDGNPSLIGGGILSLAREKGKPVFIAEAAPKRDNAAEDGDALWKSWYEPFLNHIRANRDVIGALSYINCNWESQSMWKGQGWGDSRIQVNDTLRTLWQDVLGGGLFALHGAAN